MSGRGVAVDDAAVRAITPAGRRGTVEEIASAVCYLASDEAGYITGHSMVVDGGWRAKMITKFSVLYVGQIELENIGINGTPDRAARAIRTSG